MSDKNGSTTFTGHNYYADYKFKLTSGMKADGSNQLKEATLRSNEKDGLIDTQFDLLEDWYATGKKRHLKMVSPYEDGHEPKL